MTIRFRCEQLESRECPTLLLPGPSPQPVDPVLQDYEHHVTGLSVDSDEGANEDLIVINPAGIGFVEVLHHLGMFNVVNGVAVPAGPVTEVSRTRMLARTNLVIVVEAGVSDDIVVNNTATRCRVHGGGGDDYIVGGSANDILAGSWGGDLILGRGGNDWMQGDADVDRVYGGEGNDVLEGGGEGDYLYGEAGADTLRGGPGNDSLFAGADSDVDRLAGGEGADTFHRHWVLVGNTVIPVTVDVLDDFSAVDDEDVQ
jgi:Ca2+-binding RTX toxin-like protein